MAFGANVPLHNSIPAFTPEKAQSATLLAPAPWAQDGVAAPVSRNPFAFPPMPVKAAPKKPIVAVQPIIEPPARPIFPYVYVGKMDIEAEKHIVLSTASRTISVKRGDKVGEDFLLEGIVEDGITVTHTPTQQSFQLSFLELRNAPEANAQLLAQNTPRPAISSASNAPMGTDKPTPAITTSPASTATGIQTPKPFGTINKNTSLGVGSATSSSELRTMGIIFSGGGASPSGTGLPMGTNKPPESMGIGQPTTAAPMPNVLSPTTVEGTATTKSP